MWWEALTDFFHKMILVQFYIVYICKELNFIFVLLAFVVISVSELRVVLLGNSLSERCSVGNFLLTDTKLNAAEELECCVKVSGKIQGKEIVLINTPDLLRPKISEDKLKEHVETCVRLSDPGPHVFLLVLQPENFREHQKMKLCRVLKLFSDQSFEHSLVLVSPPTKGFSYQENIYNYDAPLQQMIRRCGNMSLKFKQLDILELLKSVNQILERNNRKHVICHHTSTQQQKPVPNSLDYDQSVGKCRKIFL